MSDREHDKYTAFSYFKRSILKRAKKKFIGNSLASALANVSGTPLRKSYWNTWHCNEIITVSDNKATSQYCKNRWCLLCQSIKTANLIFRYKDSIEALEDPYFVTLTAPNVVGEDLHDEIRRFGKCWTLIRKNAHRTRKDFDGIRKCECTVRPNNEYHYHYHIIVSGKDNAKWLIKRWMDVNLSVGVGCSRKGQHLRPLASDELLEMFKYFTKLIAYDEEKQKRYHQPPEALDVIFQAMKRTMVFKSFGKFKPIDDNLFEVKAVPTDLVDAVYYWYGEDWYKSDVVGNQIGEGLSGFKPTNEIKNLWGIKDIPPPVHQLSELEKVWNVPSEFDT